MLRRGARHRHDPGAVVALLFLASHGLGGLPGVLARAPGAASRVAIVDFAAEELPERDELVGSWRSQLTAFGLTVVEGAGALGEADVVFVGGGNPFHLIDRLRQTGVGRQVVDLVGGGVVYVGLSAGAIVAGPTLDPIVTTSPFRYPPGLDLTGLGLIDAVVLPHDDREGRAERHEAAERRFAGLVRTVRIRDDQALVVSGDEEEIVESA